MSERDELTIEPSRFEPLGEAAAEPPVQSHPLRWVIAATAGLFILIMAFLFTSRSLQVVVEAETPFRCRPTPTLLLGEWTIEAILAQVETWGRKAWEM